jgi:SAM-dependent methyltransferase
VALRKRIALWLGRRGGRSWVLYELLRDLAEHDPNDFHRFLWSHHLAYAETYSVAQRFGAENLHPTRHMLLDRVQECLKAYGVESGRDVHSVFDVGCSLGYVLRFAETDVFTSASIFRGLDIDRQAIETGSNYLQSVGSKVELVAADMTDADRVMGTGKYDVVLCCGVLMYLNEATASAVVATMLRHTRKLLAIKCLAHPAVDNRLLTHSESLRSDSTIAHNLDRMISDAGGKILFRHWDGTHSIADNTIYMVIAAPQ